MHGGIGEASDTDVNNRRDHAVRRTLARSRETLRSLQVQREINFPAFQAVATLRRSEGRASPSTGCGTAPTPYA